MLSKIKKSVKRWLVSHMDLKPLERFVPNINVDCTKAQKRALVVYVDYFRSSRDLSQGTVHTNRQEFFQIIKCFIQLDYVIDVCSCDDEEAMELINQSHYDVILGMGNVFRKVVNKHSNAFSILYLTENPYSVSYAKEKERLDYLYERKGIKKELYRTGRVFKDKDEEMVDAVICMCDINSLRGLDKTVRYLCPSGFYNKQFVHDFSIKKKESFLVFGTAGFVHKGIDILVHVFEQHPEWDLYLCGHNNSQIIEELGYDKKNNIHDCGYLDVNSDKYLELVNKCVYILLPSCSEASPTAVLTGMRHGMIPIITKGLGLDELSEYCMFFDDYKVESVERKLIEAVSYSNEQLEARSKKVYEYANEHFSLESFTYNLGCVLQDIIVR